jgi:CheY-like chemotaxis protein
VLLIEDNPGDVRLFREAMTAHGADVNLEVITDGENAIRRLKGEAPYTKARRPHLVILDLNLPKVDGRDVLAALKGDPELQRIPVVVLTTSGAAEDIKRAYDLHANCYIRKPAAASEYMDAVARCEIFWLNVVRLPNR